jgi:hypothetical protein
VYCAGLRDAFWRKRWLGGGGAELGLREQWHGGITEGECDGQGAALYCAHLDADHLELRDKRCIEVALAAAEIIDDPKPFTDTAACQVVSFVPFEDAIEL